MEEMNWSRDEAKIHLYADGYNIHTAYDPELQSHVDAEFVDNASKWYKIIKVNRENEDGSKEKVEVQRQGAMVVIDNETGNIVAGSGGLGEKKEAFGTNRMNIKGHNPGSCIKPIAVVAPSMEEGLITLGTVVDDSPVTFGKYKPNNWYSPKWMGYMNMREIIGRSSNVPEVTLLQQLTLQKSLSYLQKMGVNTEGEESSGLALALGGMAQGLTAVEMAGAYATIANGGIYREPKYYTKIVDNSGNTILEPERTETRVLSEQNAWLMQSLLKEPIYAAYGTGGASRISGQECRGKTGTTNANSSAWFCGFTKYYTASVWLGFDREADGNGGGNADSGICGRLYAAIMTKAHQGKEKQDWQQPRNITTAVVCASSGQLATDNCRNDPEGNKAYTEYFATGTQPKDYCTTHVKVEVCKKTGLLANENCAEKEERVFITRPASNTTWSGAADAKYMAPTKTCEECKAKPVTPPPDTNTTTNPNTNTTTNPNTNTTAKPNTNTTTKPNTNTTTKPNTNTTTGNTTKKP